MFAQQKLGQKCRYAVIAYGVVYCYTVYADGSCDLGVHLVDENIS